ncbi:MAG: radical SAM protein [Candidatus Omnitrophica bacterium]|nr:radical SAM protein [Candidatus Omnitrophota bacterium]
MDHLGIDSHKLMYHVERVNKWQKGEDIFPIYVEVGLYGACNHRCIFCAFDFLGHKNTSLDDKGLKKFIIQAAKGGVKAILYSGEGEPLLHDRALEIIAFTKRCGIDVALVTNGVLLDKITVRKLLRDLSWLKVSLDAATRNTYSLIHGARKDDFDKVMRNLKEAVRIRNKFRYGCVIGAQALLLPQNLAEMGRLAKLLKEIGVDYLAIKPYCQHALSNKKTYLSPKGINLHSLEKDLERYSDDSFRVILRKNAIGKMERDRPYNKCFGVSFATHITASGDVYPCNAFIGSKEYCYGNICKKDFRDIWLGPRRKRIISKLNRRLSVSKCRVACRLDEINRYLWELRHTVDHVNFI